MQPSRSANGARRPSGAGTGPRRPTGAGARRPATAVGGRPGAGGRPGPGRRPSGGRSGSKSRQMDMNVWMMILTVLLGIGLGFGIDYLYEMLKDQMPMILLMGVLFGALALILGLFVMIVSSSQGAFDENVITTGGMGMAFLTLIVSVILTGLLAAGGQWVYTLEKIGGGTKPTSYIFVVDHSSSMDDSDPDNLRYRAINETLRQQKSSFPYMVYRFDSDCERAREMGPISDGLLNENVRNSGATSMKEVMEMVINDYHNGIWDGGARPKVVLLTDGAPTDFHHNYEIDHILEQYVQEGITISTVGMAKAEDETMQYIADQTNGVYVRISDESEMDSGLNTAAISSAKQDLISARPGKGKAILHGIIRVLVLFLVGMLIRIMVASVYGQPGDSYFISIIASLITAFLAALVMELGTDFGLDTWICRVITCALLSFTFCLKPSWQFHSSDQELTRR